MSRGIGETNTWAHAPPWDSLMLLSAAHRKPRCHTGEAFSSQRCLVSPVRVMSLSDISEVKQYVHYDIIKGLRVISLVTLYYINLFHYGVK